jgi:hypothetical protein
LKQLISVSYLGHGKVPGVFGTPFEIEFWHAIGKWHFRKVTFHTIWWQESGIFYGFPASGSLVFVAKMAIEWLHGAKAKMSEEATRQTERCIHVLLGFLTEQKVEMRIPLYVHTSPVLI